MWNKLHVYHLDKQTLLTHKNITQTIRHTHTHTHTHTLLLVEILLIGRLVGGGLDVCVLDAVDLLLHGHIEAGLVPAHVHVAPVALAAEGHVAGQGRAVRQCAQ